MYTAQLISLLALLVSSVCKPQFHSKSSPLVNFNIRVINMNVWGVRYSADRRSERMKGIATFLRNSDYDLVFIQELWSFSDYKLLMSSYGSNYGTKHGTPGSMTCPSMSATEHSYIRSYVSPLDCNGLTILSKFPITDTEFLFFSQQAPRVPENLVRKGAVSVRLSVRRWGRQLDISAINSHFSGWFSPTEDEYSHIRSSQARELRRFAGVQQSKSDVVIVAADLNSTPESPAYRELTRSLKDVLVEYSGNKWSRLAEFNTWGHQNNTWSGPTNPAAFSQRSRIDYVLFRARQGVQVKVGTYRTVDNKITLPGGGICSLSDHMWNEASLDITKYS